MNIKIIYCLNLLFDLLIILTPFLLLFNNGGEKFVIIFYVIYLPSLIFNQLKKKHKKNIQLIKQKPIKKEEYFEIH